MAQGDVLTRAKARHLLRRTGFGAMPAEIDRLLGELRSIV